MDPTGGLDTSTYIACLCALLTIVLAIAFLVRSYHVDASSHGKLSQLTTRMAVLRVGLISKWQCNTRLTGLLGSLQATSLNTQTLLSIGTFETFMEVYSRPMLSLLCDFQALLDNQVRNNFLYRATQQQLLAGRDKAHQDWPTHIMAHALAEFLAWLEIYRVQSQTMQNSARAA